MSGETLSAYLEAKKIYLEGDLERALPLFQQLHRASPSFSNASFMLGKVYFFQGKPGEAEAVWKQTLARNPNHTDSRKWLCRLYLLNQQAQKAGELVSRALADDSEDPELLILLGKSQKALGNYSQAIEYYKKAQLCEEKLAEARLDLAEIYRGFGLSGQAALELERALRLLEEQSPLSAPIRSLLAGLREEAER